MTSRTDLQDLIDSDVPAKYQATFQRYLDTTRDSDSDIQAIVDLVRKGKIQDALDMMSDNNLAMLALVMSRRVKNDYIAFVTSMRSAATSHAVQLALAANSIDKVIDILDKGLAELNSVIVDGYSIAGKAIAEDIRVALQGLRPSSVTVTFGTIADKVQTSETSATNATYVAQRSVDAARTAEDAVKASAEATKESLATAEQARVAAEKAMDSIRRVQTSAAAIKDVPGDVTEAVSIAMKRAVKASEDAARAMQRIQAAVLSSPANAAQAAMNAANAAKEASKAVDDAKIATQSVEDGIRELRPSVGVSFDPGNPRAAQEANQLAYDFIREISDEQRQSVRNAVTAAISAGQNPRQAASAFRDSIGLTSRQQESVDNYRRLLERGSTDALNRALRDRRFDPTVKRSGDTPLTPDQIDNMVSRYREKYIAYRADTIARTESTRAVAAANNEAFRQTITAANIDPDDIDKRWNATHDDRTRWSHRAMDTQIVHGMDTPFISGLGNKLMYPGDRSAPPNDTIQCRCVVTYRLR